MITVRITELLEQRGKSLYWLAKQTGIRYSTVHDLSRGEWKAIKRTVIEALCEALECDPGELILRRKRYAAKKR
jgi:putative transcriptional regulator